MNKMGCGETVTYAESAKERKREIERDRATCTHTDRQR